MRNFSRAGRDLCRETFRAPMRALERGSVGGNGVHSAQCSIDGALGAPLTENSSTGADRRVLLSARRAVADHRTIG